jgi:phage shock protein A
LDEKVKNLSTQVQTTDSRIQTLSSELSNLQKQHQDLETQKANKAENEVAQLTNTQTTVQQKIESVNGGKEPNNILIRNLLHKSENIWTNESNNKHLLDKSLAKFNCRLEFCRLLKLGSCECFCFLDR